MAFRVAQKGAMGGARRVVGPWLHALLFEDWWLKLLALIITLGFWYAVTGQRAPATERLQGVQLEFISTQDVEISNDFIKNVDVTVEGSQRKLDEINARNLAARVNITQLKPGDRVARLTPDSVSLELPDGVQIVRVEPSSVALRLEPVIEREVEVEARFEGKLPESFSRGVVQITPDKVRVRGPESRVNTFAKARTETISLEGQRESLSLPRVAIDIPDHRVVPLVPAVSVRVEIIEERVEKRFANVPVRSVSGGHAQPASVSVLVRGPRSVIENLRADELVVTLAQSPDGALAPRLTLPPSLEGRVELVSTSPAAFTVNR
ncbi:MAG: hypothetical protein LC754_18855 [Acidobacteria bacterium]|nr:hypothetical protein [Acidobacteriota bacterium]